MYGKGSTATGTQDAMYRERANAFALKEVRVGLGQSNAQAKVCCQKHLLATTLKGSLTRGICELNGGQFI